MGRDVLKSDSAGLSIPEVGLEMEAGSLGGVYTTVEGLLKKVRGNLIDDNPFFAASVEAESEEEKKLILKHFVWTNNLNGAAKDTRGRWSSSNGYGAYPGSVRQR